MSHLREKIQEKIAAAKGDADKAAIAVCLLLEDEIGLEGNGWFDDDLVMEEAFKKQREENKTTLLAKLAKGQTNGCE
jgi:hypothetical protein